MMSRTAAQNQAVFQEAPETIVLLLAPIVPHMVMSSGSTFGHERLDYVCLACA